MLLNNGLGNNFMDIQRNLFGNSKSYSDTKQETEEEKIQRLKRYYGLSHGKGKRKRKKKK